MNKEQQEAERLIELFRDKVEGLKVYDDGNYHFSYKEETKNAKACAAICVKEIIAAVEGLEIAHDKNFPLDRIFLNKVLNHITHE